MRVYVGINPGNSSQQLWRGPEETTENLSQDIVRAQIRNEHRPNSRPDIYRYTTVLGHGKHGRCVKNVSGKFKMKEITWKI